MRVEVQLLGGFEVRVDGVPAAAPERRSAASLVKLLALTPGHRLTVERVVDALWPDLLLEDARPRLHKAAHFARRATGCAEAVVLRGDTVALFPGADLLVDVERFERESAAALDAGPQECRAAAALCTGELLPEDLYDQWAEEPRERVRVRRLALLRAGRCWDEVLALDPADETAHLALLRAAVDAGDRREALRRYDRMEQALADELGMEPSPQATVLRERALAAPAPRPRPPQPASARTAVPALHPLVEREPQLTELTRLVEGTAVTGAGAVVLVTGEAGSGKTALVSALTARVGGRVAVLTGRCDDLIVRRTLGPFRDMADDRPGPLGEAFAEGGSPDRVLPALLRVLAAEPTLLVVEDVHWADDATLDALRFAARRITAVPGLLLLTCREDELERAHPLRQLLGSLGAGVLHRVPVPPLTVRGVAELAGGGTDPQQLHRVTHGNAFFVTEVLATRGPGVPETVRDAVLARIGRLSREAQDAVARLAVLPTRPRRTLAGLLSGGQVGALLEAERAGVLTGDAGHIWFRHELARLAVLGVLTPGEQVEAHSAVLDALVASGDVCTDLQLQAWVVHHARAARRDDVLLSDGPRAAAEAAGIGAHRQAAETLQAVLEVGQQLPDIRRAELLTRRAYSLYYVNEFQASYRCAVDAARAADRSGDPVARADAQAVLAKAALWTRGPLAARRAAEQMLELVQIAGDAGRRATALTELARANSNLATLGVVAEPTEASARFADEALALSCELDLDDVRCLALFYRGSARLDEGDERGVQEIDDGIRLATSNSRLELRVRACVNAAGSAYRAGRAEEAERYVTLGLRLAEDGEFFGGEYRLRLTRAAVRATTGRWDTAVAELEDLLALPGDPAAMGQLAAGLLARLRARRGQPGASGLVQRALEGPCPLDDPVIGTTLAAAALEVAWLEGRLDDAVPSVHRALAAAGADGHRVGRDEVLRYLQRAGRDVPVPHDAVGPWAPALAGRPLDAAVAWGRLGERYEQAVEQVLSGDIGAVARGRRTLQQLGARQALETLGLDPDVAPPRPVVSARG